MGEFINPAIVPKVKVYTGEEIPGMGIGTFGSDRVSAGDRNIRFGPGERGGSVKCSGRSAPQRLPDV